eukprot:TRINITY_DN25303_c0_g1_i1.p1 TRINITY_DN25303_c0_g1~~TRINITY_DN25303_c0_g1_i1.p1  ORF type:complete len:328 (+),score=67.57 TRINITY_DN25303_c0_g1_i1:125-985(+)
MCLSFEGLAADDFPESEFEDYNLIPLEWKDALLKEKKLAITAKATRFLSNLAYSISLDSSHDGSKKWSFEQDPSGRFAYPMPEPSLQAFLADTQGAPEIETEEGAADVDLMVFTLAPPDDDSLEVVAMEDGTTMDCYDEDEVKHQLFSVKVPLEAAFRQNLLVIADESEFLPFKKKIEKENAAPVFEPKYWVRKLKQDHTPACSDVAFETITDPNGVAQRTTLVKEATDVIYYVDMKADKWQPVPSQWLEAEETRALREEIESLKLRAKTAESTVEDLRKTIQSLK